MKINPKLPHQEWMEEVLRKEHFTKLTVEQAKGTRSWAYTYKNKIKMGKREFEYKFGRDYPNVTKYLLKNNYDVSKANSFKHSFLHELSHHIVYKKITKKVHGFRTFYTKFNVKSHGKEFQRALLSLARKYNSIPSETEIDYMMRKEQEFMSSVFIYSSIPNEIKPINLYEI